MAKTKEDMKFVADAYAAGQLKEQDRILAEIEKYRENGHVRLAWFVVEGIIRDTRSRASA
jgi:hypothetical protein